MSGTNWNWVQRKQPRRWLQPSQPSRLWDQMAKMLFASQLPTIGPGAGTTMACQLALPFRTTEALDQGALLYMCLLCFCEYCFCSVLCICLWVLLLLCFMYMLVCKFVCIASALICMYACMLGVYAGVGRGVFCWGAFFSSFKIC